MLKEEDQIKTAFITPFGTYAYKPMSFGLKNAGATYQHAIQMCFADQLHQNIEAYMDDVVIKTRNPDDLIADLEETFSSLHKFSWKLNRTKCIFGVPSEKLLEFIVSNQGIEANPMKITAITDMEAPVVEPSELFQLKCASHRCPADTNSTHFKRNNPLVCRVSA
jgi:hypothetical protein